MIVELNLMEAEVDSTVKKLQDTIDRIHSEFQQHRQVRRPTSHSGCSQRLSASQLRSCDNQKLCAMILRVWRSRKPPGR